MGFRRLFKPDEGGINEVNMTPLIDVSLVLVVMLLLATPLALESSIAIRKSEARTKMATTKQNDERVEIRVISDIAVKVNRAEVAMDDLGATLKPLMESSSRRLVVVTCEDAVSHGAFVSVLDQAKVCGASEIAVTGR